MGSIWKCECVCVRHTNIEGVCVVMCGDELRVVQLCEW